MASRRSKNRSREIKPAENSSSSALGGASSQATPAQSPSRRVSAIEVKGQYQEYQGPIPHPDILRGFEEIVPGAADRIIAMAEQQMAHRIDLEKSIVAHAHTRSYCGLAAGVVVTLTAIVGGCCVAPTQPWAGAVIATSGLAGLASVFVRASRRGEDRDPPKTATGHSSQPDAS